MKSNKYEKVNIIIIIFAIALSFYTNIIGYIYIGEIMALLYVIYYSPPLIPSLRKALNLALLWAACQFLSDQLNEVLLFDSIKGVTTPLVLISTVIYFYDYFFKKEDRLLSFFIGTIFGLTIVSILFQFDFYMGNPWKWGLGLSINMLFGLWLSYYKKTEDKRILIFFTILFFIISNLLSARSLGGISFFSTLFFLLFKNKSISSYFRALVLAKFGMAKIVTASILILLLFNFIFTFIFTSDFYLNNLNDEARQKAYLQASNKYGVLIGGRAEILISLQAFLDKPFFGHGSWAKDNGHYIDNYVSITNDLNLSDGTGGVDWTYALGLIPTHSFIMGALVWGGFLAGVFWFFVLGKIINIFFLFGDKLNYFSILIFLNLFWNILFSPFGYSNRWLSAASIAFLFHYEDFLKSNSIKS